MFWAWLVSDSTVREFMNIHTYITYACVSHIYIYIYYFSMSTLSGILVFTTDIHGHPPLLQSIYNVVVGSHGGISRRNATLLDGAERGEKWLFWNGKTTVVNGVCFLLLYFFSRRRSRMPSRSQVRKNLIRKRQVC